MIYLHPKPEDDPQFIEEINSIVCGAGDLYRPAKIYVTHISGWFDHKWLGFSGKVYGALGVWKAPLTLPPFHPRRVLSQNTFEWEPGGEEYLKANARTSRLHGYQPSAHNLRREVRRRHPSMMYVWYSGDTARLEHGSLMVYVHTRAHRAAWFASFLRKGDWQIQASMEVSKELLAQLREAGQMPTVADEIAA